MSSRVNEVNGENLQDPPISNPGCANETDRQTDTVSKLYTFRWRRPGQRDNSLWCQTLSTFTLSLGSYPDHPASDKRDLPL